MFSKFSYNTLSYTCQKKFDYSCNQNAPWFHFDHANRICFHTDRLNYKKVFCGCRIESLLNFNMFLDRDCINFYISRITFYSVNYRQDITKHIQLKVNLEFFSIYCQVSMSYKLYTIMQLHSFVLVAGPRLTKTYSRITNLSPSQSLYL